MIYLLPTPAPTADFRLPTTEILSAAGCPISARRSVLAICPLIAYNYSVKLAQAQFCESPTHNLAAPNIKGGEVSDDGCCQENGTYQ